MSIKHSLPSHNVTASAVYPYPRRHRRQIIPRPSTQLCCPCLPTSHLLQGRVYSINYLPCCCVSCRVLHQGTLCGTCRSRRMLVPSSTTHSNRANIPCSSTVAITGTRYMKFPFLLHCLHCRCRWCLSLVVPGNNGLFSQCATSSCNVNASYSSAV